MLYECFINVLNPPCSLEFDVVHVELLLPVTGQTPGPLHRRSVQPNRVQRVVAIRQRSEILADSQQTVLLAGRRHGPLLFVGEGDVIDHRTDVLEGGLLALALGDLHLLDQTQRLKKIII